MNNNLIPEVRVNKNGVPVTKHVKVYPGTAQGRTIPPVKQETFSRVDWSDVVSRLSGERGIKDIDKLRLHQPGAISCIADALNSRIGDEVAEMFADMAEPGVGTDTEWTGQYADMCYYVSEGDLEDIYTAQLALSLIHEVRMGAEADEHECFYRGDQRVRDEVGTVMRAVGSSRFVQGAVDNWNNNGDHARTLELMTALYERAAAGNDLKEEIEVFRELNSSGFADFYDDSPEVMKARDLIPSYIGVADAIMGASAKTGMGYEALASLVVKRGLVSGEQITEFIEEFSGAPAMYEGTL